MARRVTKAAKRTRRPRTTKPRASSPAPKEEVDAAPSATFPVDNFGMEVVDIGSEGPGEGGTLVDNFEFDATLGAESGPPTETPSSSNGREKKRRSWKKAEPAAAPAEQDRALLETGASAEPEPEAGPTAGTEAAEMPDATLRQQLMDELDGMIGRVRSLHPGYNPPPFSPRALIDLLSQNMDRLPAGLNMEVLQKLRETIGTDLFDVDTWKGIWYVVNSTLQFQGDMVKRRITGEYETDEWGMDSEYRSAVLPFFEFMYKTYWRVETTGMENVPLEGRGLMVSNHSGQLPFDGTMIATGVLLEHPNNRIVRPLFAAWFPTLPFIGDFMVKSGGVLATEDNGERLLEQDQLVLVMPEGYKGVGKLYRDRYRLARFGRGGFVQMALASGAPLIPVSVVGAEETYISLTKSNILAKLTGFPYFPLSPTWPWFGLLGFVPLPTKWYIDIGTPIPVDGYKAGSENNPVLVSQLTDQVRNVIQEMIFARLAQRRSVFFK